MNALRNYRKIFAPVIDGLTDTSLIYAAYARMRGGNEAKPTILLLVECETSRQFREALEPLPIRRSSESVSLWEELSASSDLDPGATHSSTTILQPVSSQHTAEYSGASLLKQIFGHL